MKTIIAPSVLAADFANLQRDAELINESKADWFHIDIMDGMFVPNISFGLPVCAAIKKHAKKPMDVHLMIEQPDRYLEAFKKAGADMISVHAEACPHLHRSIQNIKELGLKAGVALNPHTSLDCLEYLLNDIDYVCLMSVNPGFGGQKFIPSTYQKVRDLKAMIDKAGADVLIQIDGGVDASNAEKLAEAGATVLVAGSYVFGAEDPKAAIEKIKF
ncbi:ribulose-phosphate 3-epimerase [Flammeovirga kamogawensis]|uniref:Ribulose-phosphate 3-epimerase n=1 Tax=Flammeovirga kamogawensis TaxID=373891 RepID=A0ABX8GXR0_9BACT|nr:ribulose-phosphate 3-epimerase [Flammeovirga kamogawensis]MBB6460764.1 ribulose-phosphate 3-epimerase [Flammeovirga kamogawensis]QWG08117.1 ribulose-phosphate 3-epimerase [Flammeovirga kamogawensis]TRX69920.1 ribulose-phosphate 3-epimerase [Flammeovirga kamogawensis]